MCQLSNLSFWLKTLFSWISVTPWWILQCTALDCTGVRLDRYSSIELDPLLYCYTTFPGHCLSSYLRCNVKGYQIQVNVDGTLVCKQLLQCFLGWWQAQPRMYSVGTDYCAAAGGCKGSGTALGQKWNPRERLSCWKFASGYRHGHECNVSRMSSSLSWAIQ